MNYTQHSDTEEKGTERLSLSFSFLDTPIGVTKDDLIKNCGMYLQKILDKNHVNFSKREIVPKHGRLNFACPYCGDSAHDDSKKRGNFYINEGLFFKCYNCGKYRGATGFFNDFGIKLSADEKITVKTLQHEFLRQGTSSIDPMIFLDIENLKKHAVDRELIEQKNGLVPMDKSKIYVYLKKRLQPDMSRFSWNEKRQQLYIFHLIPNTNKVLGYQIRNFKSQPKYITFKLSHIYDDLQLPMEEDVLEIDEISTTFGILEIDFSKPVTVFEGPLDAFLMKNAVATCSSNIEFPIPLNTLRYMYDYDKPGKIAAINRLTHGIKVFLWKRLFQDMELNIDPHKKVDLTDFLVLCKRKGLRPPRLSNYFSNDKYDMYYV